jgi:hypothetical protein
MTIRREMRKFEVVGRGAQSAGSDSEVVEAKLAEERSRCAWRTLERRLHANQIRMGEVWIRVLVQKYGAR